MMSLSCSKSSKGSRVTYSKPKSLSGPLVPVRGGPWYHLPVPQLTRLTPHWLPCWASNVPGPHLPPDKPIVGPLPGALSPRCHMASPSAPSGVGLDVMISAKASLIMLLYTHSLPFSNILFFIALHISRNIVCFPVFYFLSFAFCLSHH